MKKNFNTIYLLLITMLSLSYKGTTQDITTGLVAYYEFENTSGDVIDAVGSHNGTNNGATRGVEGKVGNAFSFDGGDYVDITNHLDITDYNTFTLSAWVKPTTLGSNKTIISKVGPNRDFNLKFSSNNKICAQHAIGSTYYNCYSATTASTNVWIHVAATWQNNQWKIYYNGVLESTCTKEASPIWSGSMMLIGSMAGSEKFSGLIDEVRIYNRALSEIDIAILYHCSGSSTSSLWTSDGADNIYFNKENGKVGIGTSQPDQALTVSGNIHAEEVVVQTNVPAPDYVFDKSYQLKTIRELESYLEEHNHLPDIPSAKEMEQNGISLSELNLMLLKQIEELTLYLINQEKRIQMMEEKNSENKE